MPVLRRLLHLEPGQLAQALPFFALYLLLFAALSLLDGLALALFVKQVGAARLPLVSAVAAIFVCLGVGLYLAWADTVDTGTVFAAILAVPILVLLAAWTALAAGAARFEWLATVFICREVAMTMVLLHFGNFLRDFFPQAALARVMPFIYAGGRVGGLVGGSLLQWLAAPIGPVPLLGLVIGFFAAAAAVMLVIRRRCRLVVEPRYQPDGPTPASIRGFARLVVTDPLLSWITISTVAFFACRTFIVFRSSGFFEQAFADDVALSVFLGRYTQGATLVIIVVQLVFTARWIGWAGLGAAHAVYGALLAGAAVCAALPLTLTTAVCARFVEGELRYGLRNPVAQLTVNLFPRAIRMRARAWSLGILIPLSTMLASLGIASLQRAGLPTVIGPTTGLLGVGYLLATLGLRSTLSGTGHVAPAGGRSGV
jgi:hypothetical protein